MLFIQPYIRIQRKITNNHQYHLELQEELILYEDKVISASDEFRLYEVHDISYKSISQKIGFLYLHTIRGVFPFQIKTSPNEFIRMYQQLKNH